jgi:hypothetical protein
LPVRAVTLFSSGVSFTLREGEVSGNVTVPLTFRTVQINDILKSLVLMDEKGKVRPAIYAAKDPIARTLQSFAVDVTQPVTQAQLLGQLRGVKVSIKSTAAETITGQIIGVETKNRTTTTGGANTTTATDILSLLTDTGIQIKQRVCAGSLATRRWFRRQPPPSDACF